jgi:hypothetical protein
MQGNAQSEIEVWRTIKLGAYRSADEYRAALIEAGFHIGIWGDELLGKTWCMGLETEVDLVVISVAELGFKDHGKYGDVCARALEDGLELCRAEIGPALRLSYKDQPQREELFVAMEAIIDSDGDLGIFRVPHGRRLALSGANGKPDSYRLANERLVFVRPPRS